MTSSDTFNGCVFVSRGGGEDRIDQCLQVFVNMLAASPTHSSEITTKFVCFFFSPIELRRKGSIVLLIEVKRFA